MLGHVGSRLKAGWEKVGLGREQVMKRLYKGATPGEKSNHSRFMCLFGLVNNLKNPPDCKTPLMV